jgi:hypothetical protein
MSNLSPDQFQQYKVDLGDERMNRRADRIESIRKHLKNPGDRTVPPPDYYNQPSSEHRQGALPGMEMSVDDHIKALSKAAGGQPAFFTDGWGSHSVEVAHDDGEVSHLHWRSGRSEEPRREANLPSVNRTEEYQPGEIQMVQSHQPGLASKMLDTAEKIAREHGVTYPRHSEARTHEGVAWSQKQMKKRGEQVW